MANVFNGYDALDLASIEDDATYILCAHCGHYEKVNKKLFLKILGGAVAGFGFWAWVTFLFAGTGLALPLCVAIATGGVAMASHSKEIEEWMSKKYDCPQCRCRNWAVITGKELKLQDEVKHGTDDPTYDATEFIPVMKKVFDDAQKFIHLSCPWWNLKYTKADFRVIEQAVSRGIHVYFYFGMVPTPGFKDRNLETAKAIQFLHDNLDRRYAHFMAKDTHVKAVVCDKYAFVGSHNFMSYRVRQNEDARGEAMTRLSGNRACRNLLEKIQFQPDFPGFVEYFE